MPVVRAWRVDEPMLLETIAPVTYRAEAGQAIAVWSPELTPSEIDLALKVKVTEVNVFGEPPVAETVVKKSLLAEVFNSPRRFRAVSARGHPLTKMAQRISTLRALSTMVLP